MYTTRLTVHTHQTHEKFKTTPTCLNQDLYFLPDVRSIEQVRKDLVKKKTMLLHLHDMITKRLKQNETDCENLSRSLEIGQDVSKGVSAWAAVPCCKRCSRELTGVQAGALGSIATSEDLHKDIMELGFIPLLCELRNSSCMLERREAKNALEVIMLSADGEDRLPMLDPGRDLYRAWARGNWRE
eukprot:753889-Hanusia_phi.AAC.2